MNAKLLLVTFGVVGFVVGCSSGKHSAHAHLNPASTTTAYALTPGEVSALRSRSDSGDKDASFRLAQYYNLSVGDFVQTLHWLEVAAKQGHVDAMYNLASYLISDDRCKDLARAELLVAELKRIALAGTDQDRLGDIADLEQELKTEIGN